MQSPVAPRRLDLLALFLRLALAAGFLSAVADRFGAWGPPGAPGVAWGAWAPFEAYTAQLNPWAPAALAPALAWAATALEVALAALLLPGLATRAAALGSGALLLVFALGMAFASGPKAPLDYSVLAAAGAALALATLGGGAWSLDARREARSTRRAYAPRRR